MGKLTRLPAELLRRMFSEFARPMYQVAYLVQPLFEVYVNDLAALKAVSRTCRTLHDVAQPLIWKHVCIENSYDKPPPNLIALIKLWHARPECAAHVNTLYLSWQSLYHGPRVIQDGDVAFLTGVTEELGLQLPSLWHEAEDKTGILAGIALLLARNVRVLDVVLDKASKDFFQSIPPVEETTLRLESQTRFRYRNYADHTIADIAPLLKLAPNLETIQSYNFPGGPDGFDWSGITSLALFDISRGTSVTSVQLQGIIKSCANLSNFTLWSSQDSQDPSEVLSALETHASTLRSLSLNFGDDGSNVFPIGSFKMFSVLEMLSICAWDMGVGSQCIFRTLPPSLRVLSVDDDIQDHVDDFDWLAFNVKKGKFPNLKEVWLTPWECDGDHPGKCRCPYMADGHDAWLDESDADEEDEDEDDEYEEDDEGCDAGESLRGVKKMLIDVGITCRIWNGRMRYGEPAPC